jgi:hypothetical protein
VTARVIGESYGELADRMSGASDLYPHIWDETEDRCAECGADSREDACISHPDWVTDPTDHGPGCDGPLNCTCEPAWDGAK